jgi:hypothetical protein
MQLEYSEQAALTTLATSNLIRIRDERVRFAHDLLGDWSRMRVLVGEQALSSPENLARANLPRWHRAVRLFGQRLLEQSTDGATRWQQAVEALDDESQSGAVIRDLFLESLFLATNAVVLLERSWPALSARDGRLLNRMLNRFLFVATLPDPRIVERPRSQQGILFNQGRPAPAPLVFRQTILPTVLRLQHIPVDPRGVRRLKAWAAGSGTGSKRGNVGFAGADAYGLVDREGEDLAVANISGPRSPPDAFNDVFCLIVRGYDLNFNFRHEAHGMLEAAGCTRAAFLLAVSLGFRESQSVHTSRNQSISDCVKFEGFDDSHDEFHRADPFAPLR